MLPAIIELNRFFVPIPTSENDDRDISEFYSRGSHSGKTWPQLLKKPRVIILAEAGAGKTIEIKRIALQLAQNNQRSFFIRLEDIKENFEDAFEHGDISTFNSWHNSDDNGFFFLDSVDEAKLSNERDFQKALRLFAKELGSGQGRAKIFITSRGSAWRPNSDLQFVENILKLPSRGHDEKSFEVFSLADLSPTQIMSLSRSQGINDVDDFMAEIKSTDSDVFTKRPLDLFDLIDFWKTEHRIGSRTELLENSISKKLTAIEHGRDKCQIPAQELTDGAQTLAAALTFCKKSGISITDNYSARNGLPVASVLPSWTEDKITTLLGRALFEPEIYGTVRFNHKMIREYLTAKWLWAKAEKGGLSQQNLREIFFSRIYDAEVAITLLKPVLAWYVLFDSEFVSTVEQLAPEVFIEGGDPSALEPDTRIRLLERFCDLYGIRGGCYISFDASAILRFSSTNMSVQINKLLHQYYTNKDLRLLLLQIAFNAQTKECNAIAVKFTKDVEVDTYTRTLAVRLLKSTLSSDELKEHALSLLEICSDKSEDILSTVLEEYGEFLPVAAVVKKIIPLASPPRYRHGAIELAVERYVNNLPNDSLPELLENLFPYVTSPPFLKEYCAVSTRYEWLFNGVVIALQRMVKAQSISIFNDDIMELLSRAQSYQHVGGYNHKSESLQTPICQWRKLNAQLFWHDVAKARVKRSNQNSVTTKSQNVNRWSQARVHGTFWRFEHSDFNDAVKWIYSRQLPDDKLVAFSLAWQLCKENDTTNQDLDILKAAVSHVPGGSELLENFLNPVLESWEIEEQERSKNIEKKRLDKELEDKANRKTHIRWAKDNPQSITNIEFAKEGKINGTQCNLLRHISHKQQSNEYYSLYRWQDLIPDYGDDVALNYRDASMAYWKQYNIPLLASEGVDTHIILYSLIFAISGVAVEVRYNEQWPLYLSKSEVEIATKLALREINDFPVWFKTLYEEFPKQVSDIIFQEVRWSIENSTDKDYPHILDRLSRSSHFLYKDIAGPLYEYLLNHQLIGYHVLNLSLKIITATDISDHRLIALAQKSMDKSASASHQAIWWAVLISCEPQESISAFEGEISRLTNEKATELVINLTTELFNSYSLKRLTNRQPRLTVSSIYRLYNLIYDYVKEEEDIRHDNYEPYSATSRDNAQNARNHLFNQLKDSPGEETYNALKSLAKKWDNVPWRKSWVEHLALQRATGDAEPAAMTEIQFVDFERLLTTQDNQQITTNINNFVGCDMSNNIKGSVSNSIISNDNNNNSIANSTVENNTQETGSSQQAKNSNHIWHEKPIIVAVVGAVVAGIILMVIGTITGLK